MTTAKIYQPSSWVYDGKLVWRTEGKTQYGHVIKPGEEILPTDEPWEKPPPRKHGLRDWM